MKKIRIRARQQVEKSLYFLLFLFDDDTAESAGKNRTANGLDIRCPARRLSATSPRFSYHLHFFLPRCISDVALAVIALEISLAVWDFESRAGSHRALDPGLFGLAFGVQVGGQGGRTAPSRPVSVHKIIRKKARCKRLQRWPVSDAN